MLLLYLDIYYYLGKENKPKTQWMVEARESQGEPKCEKGRWRESKGIASDTQEHPSILVAAGLRWLQQGSNPHSNTGQLQGIPEAKYRF